MIRDGIDLADATAEDAVRALAFGADRFAAGEWCRLSDTRFSGYLGSGGEDSGGDLNRNFPSKDWAAEPVHYRWHVDVTADIEIGTGTEAASEPETRALLSLIGDLDPELILSG